MWYPLKACLFEEGPISDVLLLYFLTYYYVELLLCNNVVVCRPSNMYDKFVFHRINLL